MLKNLVLLSIGIFYSIQILSMEKEIIHKPGANTQSNENILSPKQYEILKGLLKYANLPEQEKDMLYIAVSFRERYWNYKTKKYILSLKKHIEVIELLQEAYLPQQEKDVLFSMDKGKVATTVASLLERKAIDPTAKNNILIRWAAENGETALVGTLLQNGAADPAAEYNEAIRRAAENGHTAIVWLLLKDKRVDPTTVKNEAFRLATQNGHLHVVRLLHKDKRVDPTAGSIEALHWAAEKGFVGILKILLQDERVLAADYFSVEHEEALYIAASHGHVEAVKLLLQHGEIDPDAYFEALTVSEKNDSPPVVKLLKKVTLCNKMLQKAAESGKTEYVERLLQDEKVNSGDNSKAIGGAIYAAARGRRFKIMELILKMSTDYAASYCEAMHAAHKQSDLRCINLLLRNISIPKDILTDEMKVTIERAQKIPNMEAPVEVKLDLIADLFSCSKKEEIKKEEIEEEENSIFEQPRKEIFSIIELVKKKDFNTVFILLVEEQANIDEQEEKSGNTPLIWATKNEDLKMIQLLLDFGANRYITNALGHTALDYANDIAKLKGNKKIAKALKVYDVTQDYSVK